MLRIRILVYLCTGCGTSDRLLFSRLDLITRNKDAHNNRSFMPAKDISFRKKQLKLKKSLRYVWQLITSELID